MCNKFVSTWVAGVSLTVLLWWKFLCLLGNNGMSDCVVQWIVLNSVLHQAWILSACAPRYSALS